MYAQTPNVIRMGLELNHFLPSVKVVAPEVEVIATAHEPILSRNELASPDRNICYFEGLDYRGSLVVVEKNLPVIHRSENPWLCRVEVDLVMSESRSCFRNHLNVQP